MINYIKKRIKYYLLKQKFQNSRIFFGAFIDKNSELGKYTIIYQNTVLINSSLDDYSYVQKNCEIINTNIGKFCSIARNVTIGLANHPTNLVSTNPTFYDNLQPLLFFFTKGKEFESLHTINTIKSDVWIGQNALIKSGVTIGIGAVVGAGAVVTKDVDPYSIVAGVPAKHIKYRFEKELRERLLASKWWDFDEKKLIELAQYFKTPEVFLDKIKEHNEI